MLKPILFGTVFILIFIGYCFEENKAFGETKSFTVAARNYEQIPIFLKQGDELEFKISVNDGNNDDINFILGIPGKEPIEGMIYETFDDQFTAPISGTYVFTFDNRISIVSNKSVQFNYDITKNIHHIYVADLPEYAKDYASNAVYDATEYWKKVFTKKQFFVTESPENADIMIQWVRDFTGAKHVGFQYQRLIEVGLGDSYCLDNWNPYSRKHVTEIMTHEIGHGIGLPHSEDPKNIMYDTANPSQYHLIEENIQLGSDGVAFIPICIGKESSSVNFSVKTSSEKYGFDVFIIPSKDNYENLLDNQPFVHYGNDCFGENYLSFSGQCNGIIQGSGVLVVNDNKLSPISSVTIQYQELEHGGKSDLLETKLYTIIHETAKIEVSIFGDMVNFNSGIFQNQDDLIRFEGDGLIIHRYDDSATLGRFFNSLGFVLTNDCIILPDQREFCENTDYSLRFFVNGKERENISNYIINTGDSLKISYDEKSPRGSPVVSEPIIQRGTPIASDSTTPTSSEKEHVVCGEGTIQNQKGQCVPSVSTNEKNSSGGGCLIATATYGTELAPQIQLLREVRDSKLMNTNSGIAFMSGFNQLYYSFSPSIADLERENPMLQYAVRIFITPMISTLSIMTLSEEGSEVQVLGLGMLVIGLNIGMYVVAPTVIGIKIRQQMK